MYLFCIVLCFTRFHVFNGAHPSETVPPGSNIPDEQIFARSPPDTRQPRGWLVDLINKQVSCLQFLYLNCNFYIISKKQPLYRFGHLGGFQILLDRFQNGQKLSVTTIYALIRPFGLCHEHLTAHTITKYLMPIVVSNFQKHYSLISVRSTSTNLFF